ncbi:MAG: ATP-binding protein [Pseudonocardiaceae bacterium]
MVVEPLGPADVGELLGLDAADAIDAYLVVGGFPGVVSSWPPGTSLRDFVDSALAEPTSPLVVMGERSLAAEFPPDAHARRVLEVIGSGRRTFRAVADRAGVSDASLTHALQLLIAKRVIAGEDPLSTRQSRRLRRYRVADPYLSFWLRFVGPRLDDVGRGRPELATSPLWSAWNAYRGLAVEPLVREAIDRLLPEPRFGDTQRVGSWWSRAHDAEVDLVGVTDQPSRIEFVGSIKWRDRGPFDDGDAADLAHRAPLVPGTDGRTRHVGVSRAGFATARLDLEFGPEDLVQALR